MSMEREGRINDALPEFSRRVQLSELEGRTVRYEVEARPDERAALATRFGLQSVDALAAALEVRPADAAGRIAVLGSFSAEVVQTCIVTLDPVPARVEDQFTVYYARETSLPPAREVDVAIDAEDPPEPVIGDAIDLGEAVVQHFAMALDPYPRCPDASIEALEADPGDPDEAPANPFAVLARLKGE